MPAVIRLTRTGTQKKPVHRIVVIDKRNARDGKPIETLGFYDPKVEPAIIKVDKLRAEYWIGVGALPSPAVRTLLKKQGVDVIIKKKAVKKPAKKAAK